MQLVLLLAPLGKHGLNIYLRIHWSALPAIKHYSWRMWIGKMAVIVLVIGSLEPMHVVTLRR
jgi:hypothetical protein